MIFLGYIFTACSLKMYADFATSVSLLGIARLLKYRYFTSEKVGLLVNRKKTKIMINAYENEFIVDGKYVEKVTKLRDI